MSGEGDLPVTTLSIPGLAQTMVDVLVNVNLRNGVKDTLLLQPKAYDDARHRGGRS